MPSERLQITVTESGAKVVSRNINDIGRASKNANKGVQLLRRALTALGGALLLRSSIRILADFSQAMSTVKAITNATTEEFTALRETAKDLGATTRFTATQAGEGMLFLARAGFTTNQVLSSIKGTLQLAQAGALDLGRAADIASNVLKGFNLQAEEMGRVVDVMANTANSANTNVEQLGQAMSFVAPAAAAVGIDVEEAAAAVGALSDAGVQATRAGTGLRQVFVKLIDPTSAARDIIKELDLNTRDLDITQRGLVPVLQSLSDANITLAQAAKLVGTRQAANLLILTKSIPKIEELSAANDRAAGTAQRVSDIMDDNLNGALLRVKSAAESVVLALGDAGAESSLTGSMNRLAALLRLLAAHADELGVALLAVGAIITAKIVAVIIPALIGSIVSLSAAIAALSTTLLPALAVVGVTVFAAIAIAAEKTDKTMKEVFGEIIELTKDFAASLLEPTEAIAEFETRISALIDEVEDVGGASKFSKDELADFISRVQALRDEVNKKLLFQQFLAPGSKGIQQLTDQVDELDRALAFLKGNISGVALTPDVVPVEAKAPEDVVPQDLTDFLEDLRQEGELLKLNNHERAIREVLIAAEDATAEDLTETQKKLIASIAEENFQLQLQRSLLDEIKGPMDDIADATIALNALYESGAISVDQYNRKLAELRIQALETATDIESGFERGLAKISIEFNDFASLAEKTITGAFKGAEDALVEFVTKGKTDFRSLIDSIVADLTRLAIRDAITAPLSKALGLGGAAGSGIVGTVPGEVGGGSGGGDFSKFLTSLAGSLFGFAEGGSFDVSPKTALGSVAGGGDNRVIGFKAKDGENVTVTKPGQGAQGGKTQVVNFRYTQNITTPNAPSFRDNASQTMQQAQQLAARIKFDDA